MKNALLIFGGNSFEHDISIITALIVYKNAKNCGYNLLPVYITKNEEWFYYAKENLTVESFKDFDKNFKSNGFKKTYLKTGQSYIFYKQGCFEKKIYVDCALNCCHGGKGEDGGLVNVLENSKIPITSGSSTALGICMDKVLSKQFFNALKIPTIKYFKFTKEDFLFNKDKIYKKIDNLSLPIILKPSKLGSSIGIEIVKSIEDFDKAAQVALEFDDVILVEKAILNGMREYNVAVMRANKEIVVSELDKPLRQDEILSFKDKYIGNEGKTSKVSIQKGGGSKGEYLSIKKLSKVDLADRYIEKIKYFSKKVYKELQLEGVVRIDYIVDDKNKIYINEINTVPGSLAYYFFVPNIFDNMSKYIKILLDTTIKNYENKNNIKREFITKLI